jgi:hypothetical protein
MLRVSSWYWIQTTATRVDVGRVRRRDAIEVKGGEAETTDNLNLSHSEPNPGQMAGKGIRWKGLALSFGPRPAL